MIDFIAGVWVTFKIGNNRLVGRTVETNEQQLIGVVDDLGGCGHIPFEKVVNSVDIIQLNIDESVDKVMQEFYEKQQKESIKLVKKVEKNDNEKKPVYYLMGKGGEA